MRLSPDELIFWQYGFIKLNATIVYTWGLMLVMVVGSKIVTGKLSTDGKFPAGKNFWKLLSQAS